MFKNAFKNLGKFSLYIFIPMGIFYLFLIIAVLALLGDVVGGATKAIDDIVKLVNDTAEGTSASVSDFLAYSFDQIDWNGNIFSIIRQVLSDNWLIKTIEGFFESIGVSTAGFESELSGIVARLGDTLNAGFYKAVATCCLGLFLADFVTRFAVRRKTAARGVWKFILAHTVAPLFQSIVIIVFLVLLALIKYYVLLVLIALIALTGTLSIISSWIIHGEGKLKLKEVLTVKNLLKHFAVWGIILAINVVLALLISLISPLVAILIAIPVAIYSFGVCDVNTDAYVLSMLAAKKGGAKSAEWSDFVAPAVEPADVSGETFAAPAENSAVDQKPDGGFDGAPDRENTGDDFDDNPDDDFDGAPDD